MLVVGHLDGANFFMSATVPSVRELPRVVVMISQENLVEACVRSFRLAL